MRDFIISIVISIMAPILIGLALSLRIKRKPRVSETTGGRSHTLRIVPAVAAGGRPGNRLVLALACGAFIAVALGLLLVAGPAAAKPKQLGVTCTTAQTIKGSKCLDGVADDIMNNVANPRFLACLADGSVWCCRKSSSGAGNNCTTVRTAGPGSIYQVPLGNATDAPPTNAPTAPGTFGGVGTFHKAQ
jgi:hypothetical protein